jgi:hypothetical protein
MKKSLLLLFLILYHHYSFSKDSEVNLLCSGTEIFDSSNQKGASEGTSTDYSITFDKELKIVTNATTILIPGCYEDPENDKNKSSCNCQVTEKYIECNSKSVSIDGIKTYESQFEINRKNGDMNHLIINKRENNGKVFQTIIMSSKMKCKKSVGF